MSENKLISVVIPVYNVSTYLSTMLDSIIEQTYTEWELFLVDDGSSDGSQEIAKEYAQKDSRITFIQRETSPKGAPACRAIGMKYIKGGYLIHLDSDDIIAPYCFQQRIDYMESHPGCDFAVFPLVGFYNHLFDAKGMVFGYKDVEDPVCDLLTRALPFVVASNIYRCKSLETRDVKWDTELNIYLDADYNLQCLHSGMKYNMVNGLPDYFYRLSASNSVCKKIATVSRCKSQIYYLAKQMSIFGGNKKYICALKICAAQMFQYFLQTDNNTFVLKEFLDLDIFKNNILLKYKLKLSAKMISITRNERISQIIQLVFTPKFYLNFKLALGRWEKERLAAYSRLRENFFDGVDSSVISSLEAKIR